MNEDAGNPGNKPLAELIAESFNKARAETLKFKVMAEISPVPAWMSDPEGQILYVNQAYTNLTNLTLEDIQHGIETIFEADRKEILRSWLKYSKDPLSATYRWEAYARIIRKDGIPIRCLMTGIKVDGNGFVGFTVPSTIAPDLAVFDSPLENFFNLMLDFAAIADDKGYFVKVSNNWITEFGYTREEILNRPYLDMVHPDDVIITSMQSDVLNQDNVINFKNRYFNKKDKKYCTISWRVSKYVNGFAYCVGRRID